MQKLDGVHHFTGVTADVRANVDFWCRILGLRFVKKTLNFETTFRYHTYFSDEEGNPGSVVTFLEFNEAPKGQPGKGNIRRIVLRVASYEAIEFWLKRLAQEQVYSEMLRLDPTQPDRLVFEDFEGHEVELMVSDAEDAPQVAVAEDIPEEFRIRGIEGVRSYASPEELRPFVEHLGFEQDGDRFVLRGQSRSARWYFSPPTDRPPVTVETVGVWHHIALDAGEQLQEWRDYADTGPVPFTKVFDHYVFDSCYGLSPGGLVELASYGPGFLIDQTPEELGEGLALAPWVEPLREKLERDLTTIENPRPRNRKKQPAKKAASKDTVSEPAGAMEATADTEASVGTASS